MDTIEVITLDIDKAGTAQTNEDLVGPTVPEGVEWHLDHVAVEDETTTCSGIRIGIRRASGVFVPFEEQAPAGAGRLYHSSQPIRLAPTEQLMARFTDTTSGDKLRLVANGIVR